LTAYLTALSQEIVKIQDLDGVGAVIAVKLKEAVFGPIEYAELKLSQLSLSEEGKERYVCYCELCDEVLTLSRQMINPRKVRLVFDGFCPGCGFNLDGVLACRISKISIQADLLTNPKCINANCLIEPRNEIEVSFRKTSLPNSESKLTTGIDALDRALELKLGQLAALHGSASRFFSSLLCVRAVLPKPFGQDSDVMFIDGANTFDAYLISEHSIKQHVDPEKVLQRIHLSRAFTNHQLSTLINEKLPDAIDDFKAKLVVVSDITQLYCDPDIQNKLEALDIFRRDVRALAMLAHQKLILIVVTNLQTRNKRMDEFLLHTAHVSAKLEDRNTFTQLTLMRHPLIPQLKATISVNKRILESYL